MRFEQGFIIHHIQFLSMKLAALNPRLDVNNGNFFGKEVRAQIDSFSAIFGTI